MLKSWFSGLVLGLGLLATTSTANAVSFNGQDYSLFYSLKTEADQFLGYWRKMNKFYSYSLGANGDDPVDVKQVYGHESLDNYNVDEFYTMGTTKYQFGPTNSEVISLFDDNGNNLLTANLKGDGFFALNGAQGNAGELKLTGLFEVASGLLYNNNLVTGTIYATIIFDTMVNHGGKDFYSSNGTINLYWKGPSTQTGVPEPTSMALLSAGLLGAAARRRKAKQISSN